jgi:hypothetical protein
MRNTVDDALKALVRVTEINRDLVAVLKSLGRMHDGALCFCSVAAGGWRRNYQHSQVCLFARATVLQAERKAE